MDTSNDFWSNDTHKLVADMLLQQHAENRRWGFSTTHPWYRVVYSKAAALLAKTNAHPVGDFQTLLPAAREDLLDIWSAGLSMATQQFVRKLEGPRLETLVETVTRQIERAQEKALPGQDVLEQITLSIDGLVEAAGQKSFSYDDFFALAHALDRDELLILHRAHLSHRSARERLAKAA